MQRTRFVLLLICIAMLTACAVRTTRHMPRNMCISDERQTLALRYVTFRYTTSLPKQGGDLTISGELCPKADKLPAWATWYGDSVISVYGVNTDGVIRAEDMHVIKALPLDKKRCLPVTARLPRTDGREPLYITLGYRLTLADGSPDKAQRKTFIAEDALEQ